MEAQKGAQKRSAPGCCMAQQVGQRSMVVPAVRQAGPGNRPVRPRCRAEGVWRGQVTIVDILGFVWLKQGITFATLLTARRTATSGACTVGEAAERTALDASGDLLIGCCDSFN